MFNLNDYPDIINHLHSISNVYQTRNNEVIIFCPFCDDATRRNSKNHGTPSHGHLNICITAPVFNCFRCSAAGSLLRLLIHTGFENDDILKTLTQFTKYNSKNDTYRRKKVDIKFNELYKYIQYKNIEFSKNNKKNYIEYKSYLEKRLGSFNITKFLLTPEILTLNSLNYLGVTFNNYEKIKCSTRLITPHEKLRYMKYGGGNRYFFQELNFDKYKNIVIAEGPIDIITSYLYCNIFDNDTTFYIAVGNKHYNTVIENLILRYILLGQYNIHVLFDNDVNNKVSMLYSLKNMSKFYNDDITIYGWQPKLGKDVNDYPAIEEVKFGKKYNKYNIR